MVRRSSSAAKARSEYVAEVVVPWIVSAPGGMSCTRCDSFASVEAHGSYDDGIPHIVLPHAWFELHSRPNHSKPAFEVEPRAKRLPVPDPRAAEPAEPPRSAEGQASLWEVKTPARAPISQIDAKVLTANDACSILCGEPREAVIARRRAILAGEQEEQLEPVPPLPPPPDIRPVMVELEAYPHSDPIDPWWLGLSRSTYVNVSDRLIWIMFGKRPEPVQVHGCIWLGNDLMEQPIDVVNKLAEASRIPAMLEAGVIEMTDRLRTSLIRTGMLSEKGTEDEGR